MKQRFVVIGISDEAEPSFSPKVLEIIARAHAFSGGARHRRLVEHLLPSVAQWTDITPPLRDVFECYAQLFNQGTDVIVVFASGDPLFFGFANTLQREMPEAELQVFPAFNSLQTLCHRLLMRYDDMRIVSLTGRPWSLLDQALIERAPKIGVLTDRQHTPTAIARRMLEYGFLSYNIYVGENLGSQEAERVRCLSLQEVSQMEFNMPNCLLICASKPLSTRPFGIPDSEFALLDGRSKMITKMPIRLLALQAMELPHRSVMWDVGFCTGSVSIEARLQFPHLQVVSFEKRAEGERLMAENTYRHGTPGIDVHIGDFLDENLEALPRPDAVFIGGHGGRLSRMMERIAKLLLPGGCIVMNSVSDASRRLFEEAARQTGLELQPSHRIVLDENNPITILKASKS